MRTGASRTRIRARRTPSKGRRAPRRARAGPQHQPAGPSRSAQRSDGVLAYHRCVRARVGDVDLWFDVEGAGLVAEGAGMRERPTVVLLHGGPGFDHSAFKPTYGRLSDVAQVVYLDHRGNGRSDRGDPADWRLEVWADDVPRFCDALGIARPILLGWSFRGLV